MNGTEATLPRLDAKQIKEAARNQGHLILPAIGLDVALLDGKYHPCPHCGKQTFICRDATEGGFCCQNSGCKPTGLGDWFNLVQWIKDIEFPESLAFVADAINFKTQTKPQPKRATKATPATQATATQQAFVKTFTQQHGGENLFAFFRKPPINADGLNRAGAQMGHAQVHPEVAPMHVLALPCYDPFSLSQIDWVLYHRSGTEELPAGDGKTAKTRMLHGKSGILVSQHGLELLRAGKVVPELRALKVEGASDFLAVLSTLNEQAENLLVFSNSDGAVSTKTAVPIARKLMLLRPQSIHCIGDCDEAGQSGLLSGPNDKGFIKLGWAQILAGATPGNCHVHTLPYPIESKKGKDLRDWINDGNKAVDVFALRAGKVAPIDWPESTSSQEPSIDWPGSISQEQSQVEQEPESRVDRIATLMQKHRVPATLTTQELFDSSDEDTFLIENTLVENQPAIVAGPSKAMKTTISIDAAISLATGEPFLGRKVPQAVPVLFLTSEIGRSQVRKLAYRIAKAKGENGVQMKLYESNNLHWNTWVPYIPDPEQLEILSAEIKRIGAKAVFCDPLYLMLDGDTAASYSLNAQQLRALCSTCLDAGATPICNDHAKRSSSNAKEHEPLELDDISGAGKAEYFRQWLLVSRRERFDEAEPHKLWLSIGGSAFAGSTLALDIDERTDEHGKRTYAISSQPAGEMRKEKFKQRSESKAQAAEAKIARKATELIEQVYKGDCSLSLSKNDIENRLGVGNSEAGRILGSLLNDDRLKLVPKSSAKNGRWYDGYMLPGLNLNDSDE